MPNGRLRVAKVNIASQQHLSIAIPIILTQSENKIRTRTGFRWLTCILYRSGRYFIARETLLSLAVFIAASPSVSRRQMWNAFPACRQRNQMLFRCLARKKGTLLAALAAIRSLDSRPRPLLCSSHSFASLLLDALSLSLSLSLSLPLSVSLSLERERERDFTTSGHDTGVETPRASSRHRETRATRASSPG